jgi:hypothetical protein
MRLGHVPFIAAGVLLLFNSAGAITQIENLHLFWGAMTPGGSTIEAYFDARSTAVDQANGATFSLRERDPGGGDLLIGVALPLGSPLPPIGSKLRIWIRFRVACNGGTLVGQGISLWYVNWCEPSVGTQERRGASGGTSSLGSSAPEAFEFDIADEDGVVAPGGTPENLFVCGLYSGAESESPLMSPFERLVAGLPLTAPSGLVSRHDDATQSEPGGTLQLAFDRLGERNCGEIVAGVPTTLYVLARTTGAATCGFTGAEFKIIGLPPEWFVNISAAPEAITLGTPLGSVGCNIAFPTCQWIQAAPVVLYTFGIYPTTTVVNRAVQMVARTPSTNPNFECPLVTLCDAPQFTMVCSGTADARINPLPGEVCNEVVVGVEPRTWAGVKGLYR